MKATDPIDGARVETPAAIDRLVHYSTILEIWPSSKKAPAAFLWARFLRVMRILTANRLLHGFASAQTRVAQKSACEPEDSRKIIMTLPAAASHSDRR